MEKRGQHRACVRVRVLARSENSPKSFRRCADDAFASPSRRARRGRGPNNKGTHTHPQHTPEKKHRPVPGDDRRQRECAVCILLDTFLKSLHKSDAHYHQTELVLKGVRMEASRMCSEYGMPGRPVWSLE